LGSGIQGGSTLSRPLVADSYTEIGRLWSNTGSLFRILDIG
jgi:hypothetical protein